MQSKNRRRPRRRAWRLIAVVAVWLALPASASAHGPVDPAASHWRARITHLPAGIQAKVVDGDVRLWLRADPKVTAEIVDYRGADYLRFSSGGVYVNTRSAMWYVNQIPTVTPPLDLGPKTPPHWVKVSSGHSYIWQDGRLQALATTVLPPGTNDAGTWSIRVVVNGRHEKITGNLLHRDNPSPVWFWPILVALACVLAGLRLRRPALDTRMARGLAVVCLAAFAVASLGHQLHGRPVVSAGQVFVLALELAFVVLAVVWLARGRGRWAGYFLIGGVVAWQGIALAPTLTDGYVLLAVPAWVGRLAEIGCLAGAAGLLPIAYVMAERSGLTGGRAERRAEVRRQAA